METFMNFEDLVRDWLKTEFNEFGMDSNGVIFWDHKGFAYTPLIVVEDDKAWLSGRSDDCFIATDPKCLIKIRTYLTKVKEHLENQTLDKDSVLWNFMTPPAQQNEILVDVRKSCEGEL